MINLLSANENLSERFSLLIQNTPNLVPSGAAENGTAVRMARSTLLTQGDMGLPISIDGNCSDWIILMAKRDFVDHLITLKTLADIFRLQMSQSNHQNGRILVVKKDYTEKDAEAFHEYVISVQDQFINESTKQLEKFKKLGDSEAKSEYMSKLLRWTSPVIPEYRLEYFDDTDLPVKIREFFNIEAGILLLEASGEATDSTHNQQEEQGSRKSSGNLFTKPPALHWTGYPRETEIQVTFKFTFPKGTVFELLFREWTSASKGVFHWGYHYEWVNGILLQEGLVKVTIIRNANDPHVVELSGRIDVDEAVGDEDDERNSCSKTDDDERNGTSTQPQSQPFRRVWPLLSRVFQKILEDIDNKKSLPYSLNLVFIGEQFFTCPKDAPKISARSLDAAQTLSSVQRVGSVKFRADQEKIYALNLDQCFPGFRPSLLSDFSEQNLPISRKSSLIRDTNAAKALSMTPTPTVTSDNDLDELSALIHDGGVKSRIERSSSCQPLSAIAGEMPHDDKSIPSGKLSLHVERQLGGYKNRGRRVSFGVIHAIPSEGDGGPQLSGRGSASPLLTSHNNNKINFITGNDSEKSDEDMEVDSEAESGGRVSTKESRSKTDPAGVSEFVDELLKKAMDEVLVID